MKDTNWLWKPPRGVESSIKRGNAKCDPMRHEKARKKAEREAEKTSRKTSYSEVGGSHV